MNYEIIYMGLGNESWAGNNEFSSLEEAQAAIAEFYASGGQHDDPQGYFQERPKSASHQVTDPDDGMTYFWDEKSQNMWDDNGHNYGPTPFHAHLSYVETGVWNENYKVDLNQYLIRR